ncbi:hypothetical protein F5882DRAFT_33907 [Hyaloscypha sp. PMI_1271]|nr:hypothetical protein F5882DRAFT_33907 [Hyaloscypha sp. PMI_1271]
MIGDLGTGRWVSMRRRGVAHLPFVVRGSRRASSGTRERDRKVKGKEGGVETRLCYHRTVWGSGLGVFAFVWDRGILVSVPGIGDERLGSGGSMEEHVLWIIGKGGRGIALFTSHVSLGIPQAGYAKQPCLKIPIALDMFSQKKKKPKQRIRG